MKSRYLNALIKGVYFPLKIFFKMHESGAVELTNNLITYDLETTGLDPAYDDITQLAYSVFSPKFELIEEKTYYCKLRNVKFEDIDPEIIRKTKITRKLLSEGANVEKVIAEFLRKADKCIVASYNGWGFDDRFITAKVYQYIQKPFWPTLFMSDIDILLLAIGAFFKKDEKMSLKNVAKMVNLEFDEGAAHNAQYDVFKTTAVLPGILKALYYDNKTIFDDCILRFQKSSMRRWRFKRYEEPWPATEKQLNFVNMLLDKAYATNGLKGLLEWILLSVIPEEEVLAFVNHQEQDFVKSFSKAEASEVISSLLFLQDIGIIPRRRY